MGHNSVSFVKSAIRIGAGATLVYAGIDWSTNILVIVGGLFILAELLGILEELV